MQGVQQIYSYAMKGQSEENIKGPGRRVSGMNISKFTFHLSSSDEEESPSKDELRSSAHIIKLKSSNELPITNLGSSGKLVREKSFVKRQEDQYDEVIQLRKSQKPRRLSQSKRLFFEESAGSSAVFKPSQDKFEQGLSRGNQKNKINFSNNKKNIFFIQSDSQEEENKREEPPAHTKADNSSKQQQIDNPQENKTKVEKDLNIKQDAKNDSEVSNKSQTINLSSEQQNDDTELIDPLFPSEKVKTLSEQVSTKIGAFSDPHNFKVFLKTPIPKAIVFEFEVHKYKNFMKTEYQLLLKYGDMMALVGRAVNDTLFLEKTIYCITTPPGRDKQVRTLGYLISDFKREIFTMYDHYEYTAPTQHDRILCSVASVPNFIGIKTEQLYIPSLQQNGQLKTIYNSRMARNLKKLHKVEQIAKNITKMKTHKMPTATLEALKSRMKVTKNTSRNAIIKNEQGNIIFSVVKISQDRFRVLAGPSIAPLHILSYVVVHLQ